MWMRPKIIYESRIMFHLCDSPVLGVCRRVFGISDLSLEYAVTLYVRST